MAPPPTSAPMSIDGVMSENASGIQNVLPENVCINAKQGGVKMCDAKGTELKTVKVAPKEGWPILVRNAVVKGLEK